MAVLTGPIFKLVFGGTMPGLDEWSCSMILAGEVANPSLVATAVDYKPAFTAWWGRASSSIAPGATLEYVKFNQINKSDGKYTSSGTSDTALYAPALIGNPTSFKLPNQCTQAVTLHSELSRGRGSKGRFYPPTTTFDGTSQTLGTDGRVGAVWSKGEADSAATLLNAINAIAVNLSVVVWSQIGQAAHGVEKVSVGRVVDTQRRRRSSLDEDRQFATATIVGQDGP